VQRFLGDAGLVEDVLEVAPRASVDGDEAAGVEGAVVVAPAASLRDLRVMAAAWQLALDPDGVEPQEEHALARRGINLGRARDGVVSIRGWLMPEVAALLDKEFDACLNPRVDTGGGEGAGVADPTRADMDGRTQPQRRHGALMTILTAAAGAQGMPTLQRNAPVLVVTATVEQLRSPHGAAFLSGTHDDATSAVPIAAAWHAACAGGVQRLLLDDARAITVRDGTCVIPGCQTPATWCEIHHVQEWRDSGPTETGNGVAVCWFHHRFLDVHGWQIRVTGGVPEVKAPPWVNPLGVWQTAGSSLHRAHARVRTRLRGAGPPAGTALTG